MKQFLRTASILFLAVGAQAAVVRPAPNFSLANTARSSTLKTFHGQPVVLVFARNSRDRNLRIELGRLQHDYALFATEKAIFVAVIQDGSQEVRTNVPFSVAADPAQVASDYGVDASRFAIAVVGTDGNLDLITTRLIPASRVTDAIFNNYDNQAAERAGN